MLPRFSPILTSLLKAKGQKLANGTVLEHDFEVGFYPSEYLQPGRLEHTVKLWISDDEIPPEYDGGTSEIPFILPN
jgi:hypothetical protein